MRWASEVAAFQEVPDNQHSEHSAPRGCHCCGRPGHRTAKCFAGTTVKGISISAAPWKIGAGTKGQREPEEEVTPEPTPKVQKMAAAEVMDTEPLWADEEDFGKVHWPGRSVRRSASYAGQAKKGRIWRNEKLQRRNPGEDLDPS